MAEGFHNRMVHLLSLTLERINVKSEFEVVMIDFYNDFNNYTAIPKDFSLSIEEKEAIKQVAHIQRPSLRNSNEHHEIICEIKNDHPHEASRNSSTTPLSLVLIRFPLSIYDSIPNYQMLDSIEEWNSEFKYHTLLDFTVIEFLKECHDYFPNPNYELAIQRAGESYLSFMNPHLSDGYRKKFNEKYFKNNDENMIRMIDAQNWLLHSDLNMISFQKYETDAIASEYAITSYEVIEKLPLRVRFKVPVPIKEYKMMRKLLQISTPLKTMLIGTISHAFGFIDNYSKYLWESNEINRRPDVIKIRFFGVSHWEVSKLHNGKSVALMESKSFRYQYPKERYSKDELKEALVQFSEGYDEEVLLKIVESAIEEKHGTMLVITTAAETEAVRLSDCCIPIDPTPYLSTDIDVTAIDGAVLCDPFGICYAIGLILDGVHENANGENRSRGARYNSARRYSVWFNKPSIIIIVSEDGDVTIV